MKLFADEKPLSGNTIRVMYTNLVDGLVVREGKFFPLESEYAMKHRNDWAGWLSSNGDITTIPVSAVYVEIDS